MSVIDHWAALHANETIQRLELRLDEARRDIVGLMPPDIERLLDSYSSCRSYDETHRWRDEVSEALVELARPTAFPDRDQGGMRVMCPLCHKGSSSPGVKGYALPDGLTQHLVRRGRVQHCVVMQAAWELAAAYWHQQFGSPEEAAKEALAKRCQSEPLYRLSLVGEPKLLDEGFSPLLSETARTPEKLAWAEQRLASLGFRHVTEGRVHSWVDEHADHVVYAGPRFPGRISFQVWYKYSPKRQRAGGDPTGELLLSFCLRDSHTRDLPEKYAAQVALAAKRLRAAVERNRG
jgi:hypothetical protein